MLLADLNLLTESALKFIQKVDQAANAAASGKHKNAKMHLDSAQSLVLKVPSTEMSKIKDAHATYKSLRKKYAGSEGDYVIKDDMVGTARRVRESVDLPVHDHKSPYEGAQRGEYTTMFPHGDGNAAQSFAKYVISKGGKARIGKRARDYFVYSNKLISKDEWRRSGAKSETLKEQAIKKKLIPKDLTKIPRGYELTAHGQIVKKSRIRKGPAGHRIPREEPNQGVGGTE